MSNNQQKSSGRTMNQMSESDKPKKKRKLPPFLKGLMTALSILSPTMLMFYLIGVWDLRIVEGHVLRDGWDQFVMAVAVCSGFINLILIHVAFIYYETE